MPSTAIVMSSSISVSAARLFSLSLWERAGVRVPGFSEPRTLNPEPCSVQRRRFGRSRPIGSLDCAAAKQFVLLLQQLLNLAQLAKLIRPLLNRIGKRRLARLGRGAKRAVKT